MGQFEQILKHDRRIGARIILVGQFRQRGTGIALHHHFEQVEDPGPVGQAQHVADGAFIDLPRRMGDRLVEQGKRVAHRTFRRPGDQG